MSKKIYLHIGVEKTGTTSVQRLLNRNRKAFREEGVYVPTSFDHSVLAVLAYGEGKEDDLNIRYGIKNETDKEHFMNILKKELLIAREDNRIKSIIMSSEHLQSRLGITEAEKLIGYLRSIELEVNAIVFVRKPIEIAISLMCSQLKGGSKLDTRVPDPYEPYIQKLCNHKDTIETWTRLTGRERINIVKYREGEVIKEFLKACGIQRRNLYENGSINVNRKINMEGCELLAYVNKRLPEIAADNTINPTRGNMGQYIEKIFSKPPFITASEAEVLSYESAFRDSDVWLEEKHGISFRPSTSFETIKSFDERDSNARELVKGDGYQAMADKSSREQSQDIKDLLIMIWVEKQTEINTLLAEKRKFESNNKHCAIQLLKRLRQKLLAVYAENKKLMMFGRNNSR